MLKQSVVNAKIISRRFGVSMTPLTILTMTLSLTLISWQYCHGDAETSTYNLKVNLKISNKVKKSISMKNKYYPIVLSAFHENANKRWVRWQTIQASSYKLVQKKKRKTYNHAIIKYETVNTVCRLIKHFLRAFIGRWKQRGAFGRIQEQISEKPHTSYWIFNCFILNLGRGF